MLKAIKERILKEFSKILLLLLVGFIGATIGMLIGTLITDWNLRNGEGILLESWIFMNIILFSWCSWTSRGSLVMMNRKFEIIGLMTMRQVLYLSDGFLQFFGVKSMTQDWSYLFKKFVAEDLFRRRPPDSFRSIRKSSTISDRSENSTKNHWKKKNRKKRLTRLSKALKLMACLPSFVVNGRDLLSRDLQAYVSSSGLKTTELSDELKAKVRNDLAWYPRELEGVPGLKVAVCDSGASAICKKDKNDFLPGTYKKLDTPKTMGGIAGGLEVLGEGMVSFDFVSKRGKRIKMQREAKHVPGLPIDLVPPQKLLRNDQDGWFKINGERAVLECKNGGSVQVPFDPVTNLPMLYWFEDADKAAKQLELSLYSCVTEESNQNLSRAKKEMLRWHWQLGHPKMGYVKWLARRGLFGRFSKYILKVPDDDHPMCASCRYGKQVRNSSGAKQTQDREHKVGALKQE